MTRLRPHFTQLFALALPLVGSQLAQQAITVTDTVMLGWYGIRELAAVTLGGTIFFSVFIVGSGFALAVMPMVAAARAAGDLRQVRRVTRMGLWIVAAYGLVSYPVFWFSAPLLVALGQAPDLAAAAQDYLRIAGAGLTLAVLVMVLKSHLAALGHAGVVLWATLAGAGLNGVLNWLLIFGRAGVPELGIEGAAIASLGTYGLILAVLAIYAARVPVLREYALFARIWRPDWPAFGQVFRLGWPIGLTVLAESGLFAAASLMVGWIGERELAAHGVALQIASVTFMVHVGLSSAATVRAGQAWGVRAVGSLRDGAAAALILSGAMVVLTVALFLLLPGPLIGLFLDPSEPERVTIIAIGTALLAVGALFQFADAAQVMALGLLRGIQDTRTPMWLAIVSYWAVGAPTGYGLGIGLGWGAPGVWLGLVAGLVLAGILLMARFWRRAAGLMAAAA